MLENAIKMRAENIFGETMYIQEFYLRCKTYGDTRFPKKIKGGGSGL